MCGEKTSKSWTVANIAFISAPQKRLSIRLLRKKKMDITVNNFDKIIKTNTLVLIDPLDGFK
jgi:hypothetical protein